MRIPSDNTLFLLVVIGLNFVSRDALLVVVFVKNLFE